MLLPIPHEGVAKLLKSDNLQTVVARKEVVAELFLKKNSKSLNFHKLRLFMSIKFCNFMVFKTIEYKVNV